VLCHDEQTLRCIDVVEGKTQSLALTGWPERLLLRWWPDRHNNYLLALSSLPDTAWVTRIELKPRPRIVGRDLLDHASNARGLAGQYGDVLLVHQGPRTGIPTTQVAQGWVFTNALSTLFVPDDAAYPMSPVRAPQILDDPYESSADPSDVLSLNGDIAFVGSAGADRVLVIRRDKGPWQHSWYNNAPWSRKEDLAGTRFHVRARLATQANPRRLALSGDGSTLVVSNHLADSLTVIDARKLRVVRHIPLGGPPPDAARRGQILFNSARMTFQGQFSCASCHPDGGSDGLNWDLTRDGIGNFLNTRSLLGVKDTAPFGWYGTSPTLADRAAGTLRHLHRHEPLPGELADLTAYLQSLPPPRPLPQAQKDRPARERGRALFDGKAGCARCHHAPTFQDGLTHDVGTATEQDPARQLDTPSLRGVARTAPYLHDGRAATLEEIFTHHNAARRHGYAHRLSEGELRDLVAYLKSL